MIKWIEKGKWCYEQNKERPQKQLVIDTEDYLKKKKIRKREYARNRYRNMSQEDKQKLRERQQNQIQGMFQNKL